jgi:hypothetical protein
MEEEDEEGPYKAMEEAVSCKTSVYKLLEKIADRLYAYSNIAS